MPDSYGIYFKRAIFIYPQITQISKDLKNYKLIGGNLRNLRIIKPLIKVVSKFQIRFKGKASARPGKRSIQYGM